ncbi:hypothetical protein XELAEV_18028692mg [Xenopus laevis]|uniref:Uncharacterized protein n=1 Tax=Xenopus laevis TaxID=8355 RepID=A0A974HH09_XENLA|nr:hypothetical protein XELAEV_18028692mg [Xenopus laevis]
MARSVVLVDCHCHLTASEFDHDIGSVLEDAKTIGLCALVAVAEHSGEFEKVIELSRRNAGLVFPCLGVHPVQGSATGPQRSATLQDVEDALPMIEQYRDELVAIGEVGLDFTPRIACTDDQKEEQRNVHSRSAGRPTINLLRDQGAEKVLLHAFDGKPSVAMEGVKAGFYFSIPPSIIRSEQQKLVKQLPLENMCLETDSPALGPEKQVRNEPKNILHSAEYIARVKGISLEEVIEITTKNALKVFPRLCHVLPK